MTTNNISHRDLIEGLISGQKIPRLPVAFWRHFPKDDQAPHRLAQATTFFQQTYDFDLIKVSPSSSFAIRDWGIKDVWTGNTEGTRDYTNKLSLCEAQKIHVLDANQGSLGAQLKALKLIADDHIRSAPVIQTIFSPLSQLKNLLGKKILIHALRHHPLIVEGVLETITATTAGFMDACLQLGIDGFFFAVQHASSTEMSREEFIRFGKTYDTHLFKTLENTRVNILHIHGNHIYFELLLDYPCHIFNWHDRETSPTLSEAKMMTDKVLCGGLKRLETMVKGNEELIEAEITDAIGQVGSNNFLLGTGCVLPIITPHGNITHAVSFARG